MRAATRERMISIMAEGWPGGWIIGYTEVILQRVREVIEANRRGTWTINAVTDTVMQSLTFR
jgi:hypothetical protein